MRQTKIVKSKPAPRPAPTELDLRRPSGKGKPLPW
jgi:hypothetical protein